MLTFIWPDTTIVMRSPPGNGPCCLARHPPSLKPCALPSSLEPREIEIRASVSIHTCIGRYGLSLIWEYLWTIRLSEFTSPPRLLDSISRTWSPLSLLCALNLFFMQSSTLEWTQRYMLLRAACSCSMPQNHRIHIGKSFSPMEASSSMTSHTGRWWRRRSCWTLMFGVWSSKRYNIPVYLCPCLHCLVFDNKLMDSSSWEIWQVKITADVLKIFRHSFGLPASCRKTWIELSRQSCIANST